MPLADRALGRATSAVTIGALVFFVAVFSALIVRRRHTWVGLVLHIYGQIAIWLSLFVMSFALVLYIAA